MKALDQAWSVAGQRVAACSGAVVALLSLLADVPLRIACLRGGATCVALLLVTRLGGWILARTVAPAEPTEAPR